MIFPGRFAFYNDMGVIKDVFQSHLTQLLCLVSLDLPNIASVTSNEVDLSKVKLHSNVFIVWQKYSISVYVFR